MVRFRFKRGLRFFEGTKRWALEKINAVGMFVFETQDSTSERITKSMEDVHKDWLTGTWVIDVESLGPGADLVWHTTPCSLNDLPPAKRAIALPRARVLQAVKSHFDALGTEVHCSPSVLTSIVQNRAAEFGLKAAPHWSTIWRWWKKLEPTGCMTKLVDAPHTGRKTDPAQFSIFQEVVEALYLSDQKQSGKDVIEEIDRHYLRLNRERLEEDRLQAPSPATVYRWLGELHYSVVSAARNGKEFNRRERRQVTKAFNVKRILERYEIDHTPVDVLLVCEKTWLVLGRPWLTLVIDKRSRMIVGFYIGYHTPSATSVLYALRQAILPKEDLLAKFPGIKNSWPARGCPLTLALDNGMDLHADAVENFCLESQIELHFMGVAKPELKGSVERLFGTLSRDLFHKLPGTVFHSIGARGDYPSEERAALTLEVFTEILLRWIVDVYHQTPHRGLNGYTPQIVWKKGESSAVFDLPAYPRQLDLMVGHAATRSVFHYGIDYDSIRYSSPQLLAMRDPQKGTPLAAIKVYDDDVRYIDVRDPKTGEYLRVPAIDQEYACGMHRHAHSLVRDEVRRRFGDEHTRQQLLLVKAEIQAIVKAAIRHKKAGVRKKAAALRLESSEAVLGTQPIEAFNSTRLSQPSDTETEITLYDTSDEVLPSYGRPLGGGTQ